MEMGNSVQHDLLTGYLTHLLKLNWVFFVFQYLPKGVGLAAKGKQEMA